MATNIKAGAVAYTAVPPGWNYDAKNDYYIDSIGRYVSKLDVATHGSIVAAIKAIHGSQALQGATGAIGANGPAGPINASTVSNGGFVAQTIDNLSVGTGQSYAFHKPPTNVISIETKLGRISVDTETGDITVPVGVGRDDAIREFWFGFQKHFQPSNKAKYEEEIKYLKRDLAATKASAVLMKQEGEKDANKRVAEKVRKKYGNEKFIMVKPEDLIKFIEEA